MKKNLVIVFLFLSLVVNSQITYVNTLTNNMYIGKFTVGFKYVNVNNSSLTITLYNLNQTVYKTISVPPFPGATFQDISFVTDKLFDVDTSIEYIFRANIGVGPASKFFVYDESGAILMTRDSADIGQNVWLPSTIRDVDGIYFDGVSTKMKVTIWSTPVRYEIYNLPGKIPCLECSQGLITGFSTDGEDEKESVGFYPNPASEYLKLKYKLPQNAKKAYIKVYDMTGKLVQDMEITNVFDCIFLPANYNNGLYLYSLVVDGVVIKNEKIVLMK